MNDLSFNRGAVRPIECLQAGWRLIKDDYWLFLGITLVGVLIGRLSSGILMGPCMCGIYLCMFRREKGEPVTFDNLFQGFNHFVQSLIATLIMMVPMAVILVGFCIAFFAALFLTVPRNPPEQGPPWLFFAIAAVMLLLLQIGLMLVAGLFLFSYPLIVDRKLSGVEAVKLSFKAVLANLVGVIALLLLDVALTFVGALACYVGAFFVIPITLAGQAVAYRQVFPKVE